MWLITRSSYFAKPSWSTVHLMTCSIRNSGLRHKLRQPNGLAAWRVTRARNKVSETWRFFTHLPFIYSRLSSVKTITSNHLHAYIHHMLSIYGGVIHVWSMRFKTFGFFGSYTEPWQQHEYARCLIFLPPKHHVLRTTRAFHHRHEWRRHIWQVWTISWSQLSTATHSLRLV